MEPLWHFLTLRTAFEVNLPGDADALAAALARQVRPRERSWIITLPPAGEYLAGEVKDRCFAVGCVQCRFVGGKCQLRWLEAYGTLYPETTGTTVSVVVRTSMAKVLVVWLLLGISQVFLLGWPLLLSAGELGPLFAAGCGTPALVLPLLWLFLNWVWWREVQAGRRQLTQVLESLRA